TGPREILGDSEYGLLCKVKDPRDMSEKMYKILADRKLYQHFQRVEEKRVKDFSPEVIQKKLSNILHQIEGE
ncbi:hypothetical protein, partial [uncultured Clostridium sp.]|uniref:hypothetical protein n=1 Tax=uncultured Clostridium sp. TaxID=59620 RepID=UPI002598BB49